MGISIAIISALICSVTSISIYKWSSLIRIAKNNKTGVRFASQTKPIFGGFIFMAGIISSIVFGLTTTNSTNTTYYLLPLSISFFAGLADDLYNTPPGFKFLTQVVTGICIYSLGFMPEYFDSTWLNFVICIIWTVTLMNSLNMLDNMDAITGSVSFVILALAVMFGYVSGNIFHSFNIAVSLAIAIAVFLISNWHPSRMYMGDNGSQLLGAGVAIVTLQIFQPATAATSYEGFISIIAMLLALIIPLTDTATVSINRIMDGKSPFVGDKNHTTHNLYYLGFSIRTIALIFIALTVISNLVAYGVLHKYISFYNFSFIWILPIIVSSALLYATTKFNKKQP